MAEHGIHIPDVGGSSPPPATKMDKLQQISCPTCGSKEFTKIEDGTRCDYCGSKFTHIGSGDWIVDASEIAVVDHELYGDAVLRGSGKMYKLKH